LYLLRYALDFTGTLSTDEVAGKRGFGAAFLARDRNGKLYLLDFGAVKQVTSTLGSRNSSTGIYSMGFAPSEQVAGEQVYPSTDLYALAVTVVTLLTGKKPTEMFDLVRHQWKWRSHAQVSDALANALNKMLSLAPSQRFHSAMEVMAALKLPYTSSPSASPQLAPQQFPQLSRPNFSIWEILAGAALFNTAPSSSVSNPTSNFASVQNVPNGLFNYGGSTSWAPVRLTIDRQIQAAQPGFRLRCVEPTSVAPGSSKSYLALRHEVLG